MGEGGGREGEAEKRDFRIEAIISFRCHLDENFSSSKTFSMKRFL